MPGLSSLIRCLQAQTCQTSAPTSMRRCDGTASRTGDSTAHSSALTARRIRCRLPAHLATHHYGAVQAMLALIVLTVAWSYAAHVYGHGVVFVWFSRTLLAVCG